MTSHPVRLALIVLVPACVLAAALVPSGARTQAKASFPASIMAQLQSRTADILAQKCAGCHGGTSPRAKLSLTRETFAGATKNAPSRELDTLKLVDTEKPDASYLRMKIRGEKGIKGDRMPLEGPALSEENMQTIELWIHALAVVDRGAAAAPPGTAR